jgi:hypothetical protein
LANVSEPREKLRVKRVGVAAATKLDGKRQATDGGRAHAEGAEGAEEEGGGAARGFRV